MCSFAQTQAPPGLFRWAGGAANDLRESEGADDQHLDTCFCPLAGGEVLYSPPAFTPAALVEMRERAPAELRIGASDAGPAALCVDAVSLAQTIVMACAGSAAGASSRGAARASRCGTSMGGALSTASRPTRR